MRFPKRSLYFILIAVIVSTVSVVMFLHASYSYISTKSRITEQMKENTNISMRALEKNIASLMLAYSAHEYEVMIRNQMKRADIFAIVVEDYNLGKVLGRDSYVSGVIRDEDNKVIEFDPKNAEQSEQLKNCYYLQSTDIHSSSGTKLGSLTICTSSATMEKELNKIVLATMIDTIVISFLLSLSLFVMIRHFVAKPIADIVENIRTTDDDGIPVQISTISNSKEILNLVDSVNEMTHSIRESRTALREQNERLKEMVSEETDIRMKKEKVILQQSKMAMMGEMIGAIAHQWRQPLNALGLNVQDAYEAYKCGDINEAYMYEFKTGSMCIIQKMSKTIDDFRSFFRPVKDKVDFAIEKSIEVVLSIVGPQLKNSFIAVNFNKSGEHFINGYQNELEQTILVILSNAHDVLIDNKIAEPRIDISVEGTKDGRVLLMIQDNGGGVPEEIKDRIFEPYFSTKEQGKGMGIGLYMAKEIIERQMGGKIYVENVENGAKFIIELKSVERFASLAMDS